MTRRLRILTFNAALLDVRLLGRSFHCPVPWIWERLRSLPAALAALDADIVCLQEVFHRPHREWLVAQLAASHPYQAGMARHGLLPRLGNELLVLSRYPLGRVAVRRYADAPLEERHFTSRGYMTATVTVPGLGAVELVNFHTTAGGGRAHPEHPDMERIRERQVRQMLDEVRGQGPAVLAGDLNAGPHTSLSIYGELGRRGYQDAFAGAGAEGVTWDPENPLVARGREASLPRQRIDHVFLCGLATQVLAPVRAQIALDRQVVETPAGVLPMSDHYGVVVELAF